ncbi:Parallel beta-helix repeat protein [Aphelenchoides fujianensis]|nr:Parallel beta-helix repeat protein [Aphelenchoides fujianensis]
MMKAVCVFLLGASLSFAFDTATYQVPDTNFAPPAGALRVTTGKFFQPTGGQWVYIGSDPTSKVVEVTKLVRGLNVNPGAAGSTPPAGMKLARPNQIIRESVISFNGLLGLGANRAHGVKLISNTFSRNNFEHFRTSGCKGVCTASGVKFSHVANAVIDNNTFVNNHAGGMWFDDGCTDGIIIRNWFARNDGGGVGVEVSARATVASNVFTGNGGTSVGISGSDHVRIYNNAFGPSGAYHMQIQDDLRITCEFEQYSCQQNLTWDTSNTVIRNNLFFQLQKHEPGDHRK